MNPDKPSAQIALLFVSYFLVVATLPPISLGWTGLALLLPILTLLRSCSPTVSLFYGACWGGLVGSYMYWGVAAYSQPVFALTLLVVVVVSAVLFLLTGLAIRSPRVWVNMLIPLPWVLSELALNAAGIPYSLSVLLAELTWLMAPLKLGGQHFLSACVYLLQTVVFVAVTRRTSSRLALTCVALVPVSIIALAPFVFNGAPVDTVRVAAVQTNSHPYSYIYMAADGVLEASIAQRDVLQSGVAQDAELVVWPEWAVLGYQFRLPASLVPSTGAQLLNAQDLSAQGVKRNLVAALDSEGNYLSVNGKAYLIPFIEQSFSPATHWSVHRQLPGEPLSTICYESVFPRPVSAMVADGAGLITILTSDAFAGPSLIPLLHSRYAILRAVESNRYAVRSANAGVSMVVSNRGEVVEALPLFHKGVINASVKVFKNLTPYTRYADLWWWGLLFGGLAAGVVIVLDFRRSKSDLLHSAVGKNVVVVALVLTLAVAIATVWGQGVYISTLLSASDSPVHKRARYSLFFKEAYDVDDFVHTSSRAQSAGESLSGALAYMLRGYGLPITAAQIRRSSDLSSSSLEAQLSEVQSIAKSYGFTLKQQNIETDVLTLPVIAVMNSGEAVMIENITRQRVTLFSPVNGSIELDTAYFFQRLATQEVLFVAPPPRSWDE